MPELVLTVETVTPLLMNGANQTPEIRAASFRGVLRYWLRTVLGGVYQGDIQELSKAESLYFGSTDSASPLRVQVKSSLDAYHPQYEGEFLQHRLLPPRFPFNGFNRDESFKLILNTHPLHPSEEIFNKAFYAASLLAFHLGGFGKRSRRGGGVLRVISADIDPDNIESRTFIKLLCFQPASSAELQTFFTKDLFPYITAAQTSLSGSYTPARKYTPANPPRYPVWMPEYVKVLVKNSGLANPPVLPANPDFVEAHRKALQELWNLSGDLHHLPNKPVWGYAKGKDRRASAVHLRVYRNNGTAYYPLITMLQSRESAGHWSELEALDRKLQRNNYTRVFGQGVWL